MNYERLQSSLPDGFHVTDRSKIEFAMNGSTVKFDPWMEAGNYVSKVYDLPPSVEFEITNFDEAKECVRKGNIHRAHMNEIAKGNFESRYTKYRAPIPLTIIVDEIDLDLEGPPVELTVPTVRFSTQQVIETEDHTVIEWRKLGFDNITSTTRQTTDAITGFDLNFDLSVTRHTLRSNNDKSFFVIPYVLGGLDDNVIAGKVTDITATLVLDGYTDTVNEGIITTADFAANPYTKTITITDPEFFQLATLSTSRGTVAAVMLYFPFEYASQLLLTVPKYGPGQSTVDISDSSGIGAVIPPGKFTGTLDVSVLSIETHEYSESIPSANSVGQIMLAEEVDTLKQDLQTLQEDIAEREKSKSLVQTLINLVTGDFTALPDIFKGIFNRKSLLNFIDMLSLVKSEYFQADTIWYSVITGILQIAKIGVNLAYNSESKISSTTDIQSIEIAQSASDLYRSFYDSVRGVGSKVAESLLALVDKAWNILNRTVNIHQDSFFTVYLGNFISVLKSARLYFTEGILDQGIIVCSYGLDDGNHDVVEIRYNSIEGEVVDTMGITYKEYKVPGRIGADTAEELFPESLRREIVRSNYRPYLTKHLLISRESLVSTLDSLRNGGVSKTAKDTGSRFGAFLINYLTDGSSFINSV